MMGGMKGKASSWAALVSVRGLAATPGADGALPARMKVLGWGENTNAHGKRVSVGERLVGAFAAPTYPWRTAALDFEHNTVPGTPAWESSAEPRPIAAVCAVEVVPGAGVFFAPVRWTREGREKAEHYCDLSAAAVLDASGEVVGVMSAALCRAGAVPGMEFAEALSADMRAALGMAEQTEGNTVDWKKLICEALGLDPAAASDEDAAEALAKALAAKGEAAGKEEEKPEALSAAVAAALRPLAEKVAALSAGVKAELDRRDKRALLDRARAEGKVTALSEEAVAALTAGQLKDHVDGLPVTVPLAARTPAAMGEAAGGAGPTADQRAIALACGADPDKVWPAGRN
jgi:phage I-like protein